MSKHTPGPWEWNGPNQLWGGERATEEVLTAKDDGEPYGMHSALIEHHWDGGVAKANARLIAAAPELLEALRALIDMDVAYQRGPAVQEAVEAARAAIAKATGQEGA